MMDFILEAWVSTSIERAKAGWMLGAGKRICRIFSRRFWRVKFLGTMEWWRAKDRCLRASSPTR
jgi:monoamine oxidase